MNDQRQTTRDAVRLRILCGIVTAGVLFCTLWPFNPLSSNQVSWLPASNGVRFGNHGVVIASAPLLRKANDSTECFSLELLLQPFEYQRAYTILDFYSAGHGGLLLRQWTDSLLISYQVFDDHGSEKIEKFDVDYAFPPQKQLLLTLSSGPHGTVVYLNARQTMIAPRFHISRRDLSGQIVLGNSAVDYEPWPGEIRGLAIYSKMLTPLEVSRHYVTWTAPDGQPPDLEGAIARYSFSERTGREIHNAVGSGPNLEIPGTFAVPHKALLKSPAVEFSASRPYLKDVLQNIAGFVPFGFVLCAYLAATRNRRSAILYTILASGALSFTIEVLQFYIPRRHSGVTDIITNTLGGALGALLARPKLVQAVLQKLIGGRRLVHDS